MYEKGQKPMFVLGVNDPEMRMIRSVLAELKLPYKSATYDGGKELITRFQYEADQPFTELEEQKFPTIFALECGWKDESAKVVRLDHHREGDLGHDVDVNWFFHASTVGQVFAELMFAGYNIPHETIKKAKLIAAADHNLRMAYAGFCRDVCPEQLFAFRVEQKARTARISQEEVIVEIHALERRLKEMLTRSKNGIVDFRCYSPIRFIAEAASHSGIPVLMQRQRKVMLLGAESEQVEKFLKGRVIKEKMVHTYGSPARGFAGGYLVG